MKKTIILTALLGALVLVSYGQSVTLYNTNIVDVENGKIIPGMTVSVKDGIITKIAKAKKKIKRNQTDYTGAYLMPGFHTEVEEKGLVSMISGIPLRSTF